MISSSSKLNEDNIRARVGLWGWGRGHIYFPGGNISL